MCTAVVTFASMCLLSALRAQPGAARHPRMHAGPTGYLGKCLGLPHAPSPPSPAPGLPGKVGPLHHTGLDEAGHAVRIGRQLLVLRGPCVAGTSDTRTCSPARLPRGTQGPIKGRLQGAAFCMQQQQQQRRQRPHTSSSRFLGGGVSPRTQAPGHNRDCPLTLLLCLLSVDRGEASRSSLEIRQAPPPSCDGKP